MTTLQNFVASDDGFWVYKVDSLKLKPINSAVESWKKIDNFWWSRDFFFFFLGWTI